METERLRQFRSIVDAGGLLKASELLGLSGGGLSKSMKALEAELGYELFRQKGRGLELTEAGRRLYERLPAALKAVDELVGLSVRAEGAEAPLRLVSFEVFTTFFLASVIERAFSRVPVEIREAGAGQMEALVADGHSDIGITYQPVPHAGVEFVKTGRIRMGIFGLKKAFGSIPLENIPFVVPIMPLHGAPSGVRGLDGWPEHLFERTILFRVEMMESALQLCRRGLAAAFVPEFVVDMMNESFSAPEKLVELPLPPGVRAVYRDVFLILRRGSDETKAVREIAKALRRLR